jgi:N-acetylglutamate synthase-like GNAT family acetyltransferase
MVIKRAETQQDIEQIRALWTEYWTSLGLPLEFQGFGEQIKTLPGEFVLLLAQQEDEPAGTIALRPLRAGVCEVKRLYVPPRFRGHGLGPKLLSAVVADARQVGYAEMYCDTLPIMQIAAKLYENFGFVRVGPYSDHPTPDALYFKLELNNGPA